MSVNIFFDSTDFLKSSRKTIKQKNKQRRLRTSIKSHVHRSLGECKTKRTCCSPLFCTERRFMVLHFLHHSPYVLLLIFSFVLYLTGKVQVFPGTSAANVIIQKHNHFSSKSLHCWSNTKSPFERAEKRWETLRSCSPILQRVCFQNISCSSRLFMALILSEEPKKKNDLWVWMI